MCLSELLVEFWWNLRCALMSLQSELMVKFWWYLSCGLMSLQIVHYYTLGNEIVHYYTLGNDWSTLGCTCLGILDPGMLRLTRTSSTRIVTHAWFCIPWLGIYFELLLPVILRHSLKRRKYMFNYEICIYDLVMILSILCVEIFNTYLWHAKLHILFE